MSIVSEFKEFAMKGNVVDLAVGVIVGGAFVKDVVMPMLGRLLGGVDFRHLHLNLGDKAFETLEAAEPTTRECPHCLSTIPLKATRCAHCTAQLQ